ncbi:hypothetical protein [Methylomonas koyamae]|uniref:hypothetical protein n=1 Tax=Methylomonas koyamae TaxID=702114 RepID=UPI000A6667F1|nr:hypothetical protein [Methylomonas koyamae]
MLFVTQDSDGDGIDDEENNCSQAANPNQRDSNGSVDQGDAALMRSAFGKAPGPGKRY